MIQYGLPVLYALFLWWFSTGVLLWLDRLHRRTFPWSMSGATALAIAAFWGLAHTRADTSAAAAYLAFTCSVLVWGWQEMAFLLGYVTGPRRHACPSGCAGLRHFGHGVQAVLYHELALLATGAIVLIVVWDAPNPVGAWTFIALWAMRQNAKLNLFLGVRNVGDEFMPAHLDYLKSYFTRKPMNLLFPLSVTVATAAATALALELTAATEPLRQTGLLLLVTLLGLGILEHWFMVLPIPVDAMWRWSLGNGERRPQKRAAPPVADDSTVRKQLQSV